MIARPARIWVLMAAAATMSAGFAALATAVPIVQSSQGLSDRAITLAGVAASIGTVGGAFAFAAGRVGPRLLQAALLLFVVAAAGLAALTTASIAVAPWLRLADGFAVGGAIVACETVLLLTVDEARRGRALAVYSVATAAGWFVGPVLCGAVLGDRTHGAPPSAAPFWVAVLCGAVALAFAAFSPAPPTATTATTTTTTTATTAATTTTTTTTPAATATAAGRLWRDNLVPCATTLHFGAFQAALLVLLPLHLLRQHVSGDDVFAVMAAFALGMLALTLPNTHLGERL